MTRPKGSGIPAGGPGQGPPGGIPARGYRWEQFEEGHTTRLTHGANHPGSVAPLARVLEQQLVVDAPWAAYPAFSGAVRSWAWSEGQAALLRSWLDVNGILDEAGDPRPAATMLGKIEGRLVKMRQELGLSPNSLALILSRASVRMSRAVGGGDDDLLRALEKAGAAMISAEVEERRDAERPVEALGSGSVEWEG